MSRIHDALRRGRQPAVVSDGGRAAHADAVLSALGYPSEKSNSGRSGIALLALAIGALALLSWALLPPWRGLTSTRRADPKPAVRQAPPAPPVRQPTDSPKPGTGQGSSPATSTALPATRAPVAAAAAPTSPAQATPPSRVEARNEPPGPGVVPKGIEARSSGRELRTPAVTLPPAPAAKVAARIAPAAAPKPGAAAPDEFQLALYYQRAGDFEQGLVHYRAALQRDEMNVEAHNNLGHLYLGKNLYDEAAREFQRVLAIDSKYLNAHLNLSAAYLSLRRFDAAAAEARAALQIDPRNPDAMVNLALAQNGSGQPGEAQGSLRRALEIDPRNAAAHYNLARQYEATGEVSAAIDHYRLFIQYASPEQTAYAADVRTRLGALGARNK